MVAIEPQAWTLALPLYILSVDFLHCNSGTSHTYTLQLCRVTYLEFNLQPLHLRWR